LTVQKNATSPNLVRSAWQKHVLWVDDRPDKNFYERKAFEAVGVTFTLSIKTLDALDQLAQQKFAAVISDMTRKEGSREGFVLLDAMRNRGDRTPVFFYGATAPELDDEIREHGGQGSTSNANELFSIIMHVITTRAEMERGKAKALVS